MTLIWIPFIPRIEVFKLIRLLILLLSPFGEFLNFALIMSSIETSILLIPFIVTLQSLMKNRCWNSLVIHLRAHEASANPVPSNHSVILLQL